MCLGGVEGSTLQAVFSESSAVRLLSVLSLCSAAPVQPPGFV